MNYIAGKIEEQSPWADWYASGGFLLLYLHVISHLKMKGRAANCGAGDAVFGLAVSFVSHTIGGFVAKVLIPSMSSFVIFFIEVRQCPREKDENDDMEEEEVLDIDSQRYNGRTSPLRLEGP
ncbi:unnamed protein product [Arabis nemorensis]|uniref:Uncharacterized protein n=1 Tax=Arabis nemorensis TaxID=586526 RepID=A0A565B5M1_9BRAS|nr:unnamed protein product [Arabis nemorensis]